MDNQYDIRMELNELFSQMEVARLNLYNAMQSLNQHDISKFQYYLNSFKLLKKDFDVKLLDFYRHVNDSQL